MASKSPQLAGHSLLLFDGVCGLCHRSIQFVLHHDPEGHFYFCALQDPLAKKVLSRHALNAATLNTVCLVSAPDSPHERLLLRSEAVIEVLLRLGGRWSLLGRVLRLVPRPLRDYCYGVIARLRYRIFGRFPSCPLPTAAQRPRFLASS